MNLSFYSIFESQIPGVIHRVAMSPTVAPTVALAIALAVILTVPPRLVLAQSLPCNGPVYKKAQ